MPHDTHSALRWIPQPEYLRQTGETVEQIENRLRAGYWLRDIHARRPAGSKVRWINLDAVNDWAAGVKPTHHHGNGK